MVARHEWFYINCRRAEELKWKTYDEDDDEKEEEENLGFLTGRLAGRENEKVIYFRWPGRPRSETATPLSYAIWRSWLMITCSS